MDDSCGSPSRLTLTCIAFENDGETLDSLSVLSPWVPSLQAIGAYCIARPLGQGGMGAVYEAR